MIIHSVRSYVSRSRKRLTQNQSDFLDSVFPKYGINFNYSYLDFYSIFKNSNPLILEIGFGSGDSLIDMALKNPCINFIGIELYIHGIISCLRNIEKYNLKNIRIIFYNAMDVMLFMIPNNSLFEVQCFFPDPWPKKRHHKRRIVQNKLLKIVLKKLIFQGCLHIVTDVQDYAKSILNEIKNFTEYINLSKTGDFIVRPNSRIITRFENRGIILGNKIFDLKFRSEC
ncbi:MAG: tRNA (guanosine(46)-N7)-methyltransferase TrmB [Buchnera aphidicola (Chaetogeoica yunlongensis)]